MYVLRRLSWPTHITWPMWCYHDNSKKGKMAGKGVSGGKGREVKGENVKNKENRKRKKQKNKNKKWNFRPPYLQVLPLLLLMFSSFSFFSKSHRSLKVCFTCSYMLIHKLLHLFLHSSSREEVWITHILHVLNPQNTNRPPDSLGYVWPTKYVLTNFCIGVFSTV